MEYKQWFLFKYFQYNFDVCNQKELFIKASQIFLKLNLVKKSYLKELIKREELYPTGLKFSNLEIAIPHVDDQHILQQGIIVFYCKNNIHFCHMGTNDQILKNVKYVFFLLLKKDKQINLLSEIIKNLNQKNIQEILLNITNKKELIQCFKGF